MIQQLKNLFLILSSMLILLSLEIVKIQNMSRLVVKPTMWFPNRSDTNRPVQLQKQARSLKFWNYIEEKLYYPSSENKGADQLRGYREVDLRLCFRLCRLLVFPRGGSYVYQPAGYIVTNFGF